MTQPPLPAPLLLSLAIAAGIVLLELLGWVILHPGYARLLPLRRTPPPDLPTPRGATLGEPRRGSGEHVTWRWDPRARAVFFRRRLELGRKPYCTGRLQLDGRGAWALSWAPFPFFAWPAAGAAWIAMLLAVGWAQLPGGLLVMALATGLFGLAIAANLWLSRRAFERLIWPELQEQLRDWLA
jgi:hypothetical protein